jgi:hypothetical protein
VPRKREFKSLNGVLTMPTSTNESQIQEISTSRQTIIETSNLESNIYHDDDFKVAIMMTI